MSRTRLALALAAASILATGSAITGGEVARFGFALVAVLFPVLLVAFAAGSRVGRPALAVLALLLGLSAVGILLFERADRAAALPVAGLPPATWLMLAGLGLAPLVLVAVVSARDRCR